MLNSGLRISEALGLKVADVRRVEGAAKPMRVIGQGDPEQRVPLPEAFGAVFGFWLKDPPRGEFVFARAPGSQPVSSQAAHADLRQLKDKAHLAKPITPHQLRHTSPRNLLNARAERVDIQALLGHVHLATTPMDTPVDQDRRAAVANKRSSPGTPQAPTGRGGAGPRPGLAKPHPIACARSRRRAIDPWRKKRSYQGGGGATTTTGPR